MATRKPLFLGEYGSEEMAIADDIALGGLAMGGNITMATNKITGLGAGTTAGDALSYAQSGASLAGLALTADLTMGSQKITGMAPGVAGTDGVNKNQLDTAVITGGQVKEMVLHVDQLDDAEGVLAAVALTIPTNPVSADNVVITDGVTTRTYQFGTGGDVTVTIGATPADTMQNLATAIQGDGSGAWGASYTTDLDAIAAGVVVITELDNDAGASIIYGTWGTQANCQIVDFGGEAEYNKKATTALPVPTPGSTNFGTNRTTASLSAGEIHYIENDDILKSWDDDANTWVTMTGTSSIPDATSASGGGVKGKVTFDRDFGLLVTSGVAKISVASNKGLGFDVSGDLQGLADTAAGMEITSSGFAIDIGATNPCVGFDGSGDLEFKLDGTTLEKTATGARVKGLPSLFEINTAAVSANVTSANLGTLTAGSSSDADALHTHNSVQATRIEGEVTAEEDLAKGDPVEWGTTNDEVRECYASTTSRVDCIGVVEEAAGIGAAATGTIVKLGVAVNVLVGATVGQRFYVGDSGGLVQGFGGISAGNHVILVGTAKNATDLDVRPQYISKKAA